MASSTVRKVSKPSARGTQRYETARQRVACDLSSAPKAS